MKLFWHWKKRRVQEYISHFPKVMTVNVTIIDLLVWWTRCWKLLKIIHSRIQRRCESVIGIEQFGFRNGLGTPEAFFIIQMLSQKCWDQQRDLYICFVSFEKTFDRVKHEKLFDALEKIGLNQRDIQILKNLHWNQTAEININQTLARHINIWRGARQGVVCCPQHFSMCLLNIFLLKHSQIAQMG